jgi:putative ABC transport system permease protein
MVDTGALQDWAKARSSAARQLGTLALRNVLRHKRRSLTAIAAVAFGVVAMLLASGFIEWLLLAMREGAIRSQLGHLQVSRSGYRESGVADPYKFLLPPEAPIRAALEKDPYVAVVAPRLSFSGLVSLGDATVSFIGEGVIPEREAAIQRSNPLGSAVNFADGQDLGATGKPGVVLGRGLAENLGAKVGDSVVLVANGATGGIQAVELPVNGLFQTAAKAYDDTALRVTLPTAKTLLRVNGDHLLVVLLDETRRTPFSVAALRTRFADSGIEFTPWYELADFYTKTAALFSRQTTVVSLIIAIIIVLSISNTLMMSVLERVGEIGTAMALGVTRGQVLRQFMLEGALLGVIGGIAGVLIGAALAIGISAVGIPMPPAPGMEQGYMAEIRVTPRVALQAAGLALLTTLAASLYPAWKASRFLIVDALRFNR